MVASINATRGVALSENDAWNKIAEITGIKFKVTEVDSTTWEERRAVMWASNDLPDMMFNGIPGDEMFAYSRAGKILNLRPYIDKYAPNFKALYDKNLDVQKVVTVPGGMIASFAATGMEIEAGMGECPPEYMAMNVTWLEKVGLKMPTNAEEYIQALITFRDKDPNGNGKKDEIGVGLNTWSYSSPSLKYMFPWFGFMVDKYDTFLDGDTVKYGPFMPNYVEAVKFLNRMWKEKLLDPEQFTMSTSQVIAKASGTPEIYGSVFSSGTYVITGEANMKDYRIAPLFPYSKDGTMWFNRNYGGAGVGVINANTKYAEALVRWNDFFYDPKYVNVAWMGFEGDSYKWNADRKTWNFIFTKELDTASKVRAKKTLQAGGLGASMYALDFWKIDDPVETPINNERIYLVQNWKGKFRKPMPNLYFEPADLRAVVTIATDLGNYEKQCFARFVTGEMDIDRDYNAFVAQLKQMGADRMVELIQKTYNANK
jgi:putative aldouronate transport system substrate-binding protein